VISLLPAIAYGVTDKLSIGASLNAMYGVYKNKVAINNVGYPDGQLKLDDNSWGWGGNLGLLCEIDAGTRVGLTWNSQVNLDFEALHDLGTPVWSEPHGVIAGAPARGDQQQQRPRPVSRLP
jgi:long-subunit fatty acid transport protein